MYGLHLDMARRGLKIDRRSTVVGKDLESTSYTSWSVVSHLSLQQIHDYK